jgi:hypothetical protein
MSGSTKDINFQSREQVMKFLEQLPKDLRVNDRLKVTCDLLGIDGYVQGTA